MTVAPPLAWAVSLSDSATMVSVPSLVCLFCLGLRIERALAAQRTVPLTEAQRGTGTCHGPPNTGPAVLQFDSSQAPRTSSAWNRRGRAQPYRRMRGEGLTTADTTSSQALTSLSDYHHQSPWHRWGDVSPELGEHLARAL